MQVSDQVCEPDRHVDSAVQETGLAEEGEAIVRSRTEIEGSAADLRVSRLMCSSIALVAPITVNYLPTIKNGRCHSGGSLTVASTEMWWPHGAPRRPLVTADVRANMFPLSASAGSIRAQQAATRQCAGAP